ncbi:neutral ceramidase [Takifugu rubripes]|uniref:neutral ceramidase n=1 Tax=Takifugu rubripes TaxID=31033 RepID=UPI000298F000|nr:neutral ceramidase-like [Takifugu rubripes]|eukprot:XP_003961257.1 PREDICTED: neutral ceramidase-like [Takifugu rubripes]
MARKKTVSCGAVAILVVLVTGGIVTLITLMFTRNTAPGLESTPVPSQETEHKPYLIGVGRADCTGPPAEIPLMGYANTKQTGAGIHTRLYSRAFIIDDGRKRVVFVTADVGMVSQRLRLEVLNALKAKYGNLYRQDNVVLSGTHTHCGLAGYFQYTLFMITSKGYIKESVQPLVNGIVKSIDIAHNNTKPGRIYRSRGDLEGNSVNRSPHSYMNNPEEERNRYKWNTDKQVLVLKFTDLDGNGIGMLSWFAVHAVSMNYTNRMVSSDNMGYASYLMEQDKNPGELPGHGGFVAGFSSSNLGDVSPNTKGPHCVNTGLPCDYLNSSCPVGGTKMCQSSGPGEDMFESTRIIAHNIYQKAKELYVNAKEEVTGFLHSAHQWVDMTNVTIQINSTHTVSTCKPALGHSFAAGTTDGGGDLNFTQGSVEGDPFWDGIRDVIVGKPSNETQECHHPKPILFSTGEMNWPLPWHPKIIDVQIITIGSVAVVAVPGEITTMSGRRLRESVKQELQSEGAFRDVEVVIAGLSNVYTHYITTFEEYQVQRYEGASTIFGPHTLSAYLQKYRGLARAIAQDNVSELPTGPQPPFFKKLFNLMTAAGVDRKPENSSFGDVVQQVYPVYRQGDVVSITFIAGNPRHSGDIRDKTFVTVEIYDNRTDTWKTVHTDASWETRFHWLKGSNRQSNSTVEWYIPPSAASGFYRIKHFGHFKQLKALRPVITPYEGTSDVFSVTGSFYSQRYYEAELRMQKKERMSYY